MIHKVTVTWDDEEYNEASTWEEFLENYALDEMHNYIDDLDLSERTISHAHGVLNKIKLHLKKHSEEEMEKKINMLTEREVYLISKIFQNYYCMGIEEIAEEDDIAKSLFIKIGLIEEDE